MLTRKIHMPLFFLMFAAMPVSHALAQGSPQASTPEQYPSPAARPTLPEGTVLTVLVTDALTSRHNQVGDQVTARVAHSVTASGGAVIIPADAVFLGVISEITSEDDGRIVLTFYKVAFGGSTYSIQARVISLPTRKQRRGNTAGDAAKVGVGAVVGGIAGRIIGGNSTGTIVGALSGAAAGTGVAVATRRDDIVVDAGATVLLLLTAPFVV